MTVATPAINQIDQSIALLQKADFLLKEKQYEKAGQMLEQVKGALPDLPEVSYLLAQAYQKQGFLRKALLAALDAYLCHPEDPKLEQLMVQLWSSRIYESIYLEFRGKTPPAKRPSISMFMITRNEEKYLARCLESVKGMVDEMVIVDTGSTDGTVEIARSYGAKVHFFEWCDDFAAARNEALKYTTCDWVLMMDADNWLEPEDQVRILEAAACGKADVFICRQITRSGGQILSRDQQFRLFRNGLGLVYRGALHESIEKSVFRNGYVLADSNISIQHIDFVESEDKLAKRRERNLRVIDNAVKKDPTILEHQILLVGLLYERGRGEEAARIFKEVLPELPDSYLPDLHLREAYEPLLNQYAKEGNQEAFRQALHSFLIDSVQTFWAWVFGGQLYLNNLDDPAKATAAFERAGKLQPDEFDKTVLKVQDPQDFLMQLKARAYFYAGQKEKALELYRSKKMTHSSKKIREGLLKAQEFFAEQKFQEAVNLLSPFVFKDAEAAKLAARAAEGLESWTAAASAMMSAMVLSGQPGVEDWAWLARCELSAGNNNCCVRACQLGLKQYPQSAELLLLCGKAALTRPDPRLSIQCFVQVALFYPEKQEAIESLKFVANKMDMHPMQLIRNQGVAWIRSNEYLKARAALEYVVRETSADEQACQMLAMLEKLG